MTLPCTSATSSGVPIATTRPPSGPAPGPRSTTSRRSDVRGYLLRLDRMSVLADDQRKSNRQRHQVLKKDCRAEDKIMCLVVLEFGLQRNGCALVSSVACFSSLI